LTIDTRPIRRSPQSNKLVLPSLILGCVPILAIPFTIVFPSTQFYLFYFLPFGLTATLLARIALNQMKRTPGIGQQHTLAVIAYFLGLTPALYFCAEFTFQLVNLWGGA
jgi:hypothetical protein